MRMDVHRSVHRRFAHQGLPHRTPRSILICRQHFADVGLERRQHFVDGVGIYVAGNAVYKDEPLLDDRSGEYDDLRLVGSGLGPQLLQ